MYAEERQQLILERARSEGRVDVTSLAVAFQVTPETVRRDLTTLERHGVLRRVHGGAIPIERLGFEPGLEARADRYTTEKERIGKAGLDFLPDEGTVLLDAGTSTLRLAEVLPRDRQLTVVTNSLSICAAVATHDNVDLYMLGGRVRPRTLAAVGEWIGTALEDIFVDVAFVGTNGISVARGLTTPDQSEAVAKKAMIAAARRCIVLADHSKFGVDHFCRVAPLRDIATVITDIGLDPEVAHEIEAEGPEVVRA